MLDHPWRDSRRKRFSRRILCASTLLTRAVVRGFVGVRVRLALRAGFSTTGGGSGLGARSWTCGCSERAARASIRRFLVIMDTLVPVSAAASATMTA